MREVWELVRPGQRHFRTRLYVPKPSDRGRGMVVLVLLAGVLLLLLECVSLLEFVLRRQCLHTTMAQELIGPCATRRYSAPPPPLVAANL